MQPGVLHITNTLSCSFQDPTLHIFPGRCTRPRAKGRMHPPFPIPLSPAAAKRLCGQTGRRVSASASEYGKGFSPRSLRFKCCITLPFSSRTSSLFASCHTPLIQTSQFNTKRVRVLFARGFSGSILHFPPFPPVFLSPSTFVQFSYPGFLSLAFRPDEVQCLLLLTPAVAFRIFSTRRGERENGRGGAGGVGGILVCFHVLKRERKSLGQRERG